MVDPRAQIIFHPGIENGNGQGLVYGTRTEEANTGIYNAKQCAEMGYIIQDGTPYKSRPYDLFLSEEVHLLKDAIFARNIVSGDARSAYESGVHASFATWGVAGKATDYLSSTEKNLAGTSAKYDDQQGAGNTALEKIITQKYIAALPDLAPEACTDKRRLNLPRMDVGGCRDQSLYDIKDTHIFNPAYSSKLIKYLLFLNLIVVLYVLIK